MYALIYQNELGYDESDFGFAHETGKGIWFYKNDNSSILDFFEMMQLRNLFT